MKYLKIFEKCEVCFIFILNQLCTYINHSIIKQVLRYQLPFQFRCSRDGRRAVRVRHTGGPRMHVHVFAHVGQQPEHPAAGRTPVRRFPMHDAPMLMHRTPVGRHFAAVRAAHRCRLVLQHMGAEATVVFQPLAALGALGAQRFATVGAVLHRIVHLVGYFLAQHFAADVAHILAGRPRRWRTLGRGAPALVAAQRRQAGDAPVALDAFKAVLVGRLVQVEQMVTQK